MSRFAYVVKDTNGRTHKSTGEAFNEEALVDQLQKQGYFVVSVSSFKQQNKSPKTKKIKRFTHTKVKLEDLLMLARQLATMLEAGVTLMRSLNILVEQVASKNLYDVLQEINLDVEKGSTLSSSLAKHPKVFSQFWVSLSEVGEASGTMPAVLEKLAYYLEQSAKFRSAIISAVIYPLLLSIVAIGAISFFALFVSPRFEKIFDDMGADLPFITVALLTTFKFIKSNFLMIGMTIGAVIFILKSYFKTQLGTIHLESILFNLPIVGTIFKLIVVERFASQMSILVESGVPILHSLEITEKLVGNLTCAIIITDIRDAVREGELLAAPMEQSEFFPNMAVQMIKVGEETGELSKMLSHVSAFYQDNVETFMKRFGTIIEPVMIIMMAGVIGVILLAMFMPMFNLTQV